MSIAIINQDNFRSEVLEAKETVLLDFWAPWCGPCRMLMPLIEEIAAEHPEIKVGKINVDENPDLATEFGVMSIPTLIVMKDGKPVNQAVGGRSKAAILAML
jgi:thioredoxin 1